MGREAWGTALKVAPAKVITASFTCAWFLKKAAQLQRAVIEFLIPYY